MREIKFRAWQPFASLHRQPGMYLVDEVVRYEPDDEGHTGEVFLTTKIGTSRSSEYIEDIVLMQYAGLKDKSGVEIYEGDIITILDKASQHTERVSRKKFGRFTVEWSAVLAGWVPTSHNGYEPDETWWQTWEIEVVGNIHQNPDLLEVAS